MNRTPLSPLIQACALVLLFFGCRSITPAVSYYTMRTLQEGSTIHAIDSESGIAYIDVVSVSSGSAQIDSFVPGANDVTIHFLSDGAEKMTCTVAAWDCALNRVEQTFELSNLRPR